jgi:hypothetical protein
MNLFTRKEIRRLGYYFFDSAEERIYLNSLNRELKKRSQKNEMPEKVKEDMIIELRSQRKRLLLKADKPPSSKNTPPANPTDSTEYNEFIK